MTTEPAQASALCPLYGFDPVVTLSVRHTGGPVTAVVQTDDEPVVDRFDGTDVEPGLLTLHPGTFREKICTVVFACTNRRADGAASRYRVELASVNRLRPDNDATVFPPTVAWEGEVAPHGGTNFLLMLPVLAAAPPVRAAGRP